MRCVHLRRANNKPKVLQEPADLILEIDVLVDGLDLAELGFGGVDPEATGRPSYHPSMLLKLYIYGYLNQVQSSQRLERGAGRNVEVMWLLGRLAPGHKTIADFLAAQARPTFAIEGRWLPRRYRPPAHGRISARCHVP
jgi:transposase